jgi:hypothetical protein
MRIDIMLVPRVLKSAKQLHNERVIDHVEHNASLGNNVIHLFQSQNLRFLQHLDGVVRTRRFVLGETHTTKRTSACNHHAN